MNTIDLQTASSEIQQACEGSEKGRLPYFFLVGAGLSSPPVRLASEIEEDCKNIAHKYGRTGAPLTTSPIDTYSHWFDTAYPQPIQRQKYLRGLIGDKTISPANFRLAHLLLQRTIASLVVTTNFDDFLSRALTLFGKQHIVCDHPSTVDRIDPEERDDIQIVHVHGSYWFYDCCNLRCEIAGRAQISQSTLSMPALLENILWRRMPLVIGYSGWEGDVVMEALERRLKNPLPNRLYWFCYRRNSIDSLPEWLKSHSNVYFVVPEPSPSTQASGAESTEGDGAPRVGVQSSPRAELKVGDKVEKEQTLSAQQVLDKLIQTFDLKAPKLTSDPLGFYADYLRLSLPHEDSTENLYFIKSVVDRLERAKRREEVENQALRLTESKLENIRDSLRRSQYREAIAAARQLQFKDMASAQRRELLEAVWSAATLLGDNSEDELAGYELVWAIYESLLRESDSYVTDAVKAVLSERAAKALVNKGVTLDALDRGEEAIAAYDEVVKRFGDAGELSLREEVGKALVNKGFRLGVLNRNDQEFAAYDETVKRFGDAGEAPLRELVAKALFNKAFGLGTLNRNEEAIVTYDELLKRLGDTAEGSLPEYKSKSLFNKGLALGTLERNEQAAVAYDEVIRQFGDSTDLTQREQAAKALVNKGAVMAALKQDEIGCYDEVINRFGDATEVPIRRQVAMALLNKAVKFAALERNEEAIAACDEVVRRFDTAIETSLREWVGIALIRKGDTLATLGRSAEALATFDDVIRRFGDSPEPALREQARRAYNDSAFRLLCNAKELSAQGQEALFRSTLLEAQRRIDMALASDSQSTWILGNKAYIEFLLGNEAAAREAMTKAIELGGKPIQDAALQDSEIHPLPQDKEFRQLVQSIPLPASSAA